MIVWENYVHPFFAGISAIISQSVTLKHSCSSCI